MLVSAAVAAGALWEEGAEGEDAENLERTLVLFAASDMSKVREAVGRVRGLPVSAFAALVHGSRRVRDNALAYVAMQPDVDADVLHLAAMWGNDLAKDEASGTRTLSRIRSRWLRAVMVLWERTRVGSLNVAARWVSAWSDRLRVSRVVSVVLAGVSGLLLAGCARRLCFLPRFSPR